MSNLRMFLLALLVAGANAPLSVLAEETTRHAPAPISAAAPRAAQASAASADRPPRVSAASDPAAAPFVVPPGAVVLETGVDAPVLLGRAAIVPGDQHPGAVIRGTCLIPQKGAVFREARFAIATGGEPRWVGRDFDRAAIVGRQGQWDLYFCRAKVRVGTSEAGYVYGKAYRDGPHAGTAYVAYDGKELPVRDGYELLAMPDKPTIQWIERDAQPPAP